MAPSILSARAFFRDPDRYVAEHANGAGFVRLAAGRERYLLLRDPDAIWQVLVTDGRSYGVGKWKRRARRFVGQTLNTLDGAEHRQRRALVQPSLARSRVDRLVPALVARADCAQREWRDGAEVRLRDLLDPLSVAMAGEVLLSAELGPHARELASALRTVMTRLPRLTPPLAGTRHRRALALVEETVADLIAARRATDDPGDDLLGALLSSGMPEQTVRGELIAFLLAAADEPPSALEAAWYLLGRHPEAEARLHAELAGGPPEGAGPTDVPYTDAVLREALRLYPPARHVDRCPVHDVEIGTERVRAGTNVLVSPFVTHRDERLHADALAFAPERWLGGTGTGRRRGAYLPFGAGVHTCVGEPLARAIMRSTLAVVGARWRVVVPDQATGPVPGAPPLVVTLRRR